MIICFDLRTGSGCGAQNAAGAQYCNHCGKPMRYALELHDPGDMIGPYRIGQILGRGSFGVVYQAEHTQNGLQIALKEAFNSDDITSFRGEFNVLKQIQHPNLPRYYSMFEANGNGFLAMEFVPGQNLEDILQRQHGPLLESQVLGYALQICDALTYLHNQTPPIIHRDIKPANIRLTPEGLIKLVDFGLLKQGTQATASSRRGLTPAYAPIEQWGGVQRTDARSDIYSLGATLFHCLTGQEPPTATDRIAASHDTLPPILQLNPRISRHVALAIVTALALSAQDRYSDAQTFKKAIQGTIDVRNVPQTKAAPTAPVRRPSYTPSPSAQVAARPVAPVVAIAATPQTVQPATPAGIFRTALPGVTFYQMAQAALVGVLASYSLGVNDGGLFFLSWCLAIFVSIHIHTHKGGVGPTAFFATCLLGPLSVALALIMPPLVNKRLIYQNCSQARNTRLGLFIIPCILLVFAYPSFIVPLWALSATIAEYIFVSKRHQPLKLFLSGIIIGPLAVLIAVFIKPKNTIMQQP